MPFTASLFASLMSDRDIATNLVRQGLHVDTLALLKLSLAPPVLLSVLQALRCVGTLLVSCVLFFWGGVGWEGGVGWGRVGWGGVGWEQGRVHLLPLPRTLCLMPSAACPLPHALCRMPLPAQSSPPPSTSLLARPSPPLVAPVSSLR